MRWPWKRQLNRQHKRAACSSTVFYMGFARGIEYVFSVTPIPRLEERSRKHGGIWSGSYAMVTLLNLTRKTYFLTADGPPLGWEYIAEKYGLGDEEAVGFTEIIGRVLGREVRLPETFRLESYRTERCLRVIPGGRSNG